MYTILTNQTQQKPNGKKKYSSINNFCFFFGLPLVTYSMGHHYIYFVLDWEQPKKAMVTVFGTLVLAIIVHVFLFWVYKLRVFIQRRLMANEMILPTKTTKKQHLNGSLGSQISMVFGGDDGCTNDAFKTSSNKMNS